MQVGDRIAVFGRGREHCAWPYTVPPLVAGSAAIRSPAPFLLHEVTLFEDQPPRGAIVDGAPSSVCAWVEGTVRQVGGWVPGMMGLLGWNARARRFIYTEAPRWLWFDHEGAFSIQTR